MSKHSKPPSSLQPPLKSASGFFLTEVLGSIKVLPFRLLGLEHQHNDHYCQAQKSTALPAFARNARARGMAAFSQGFSLVEIMVTIAVLGVIAGIAIPSFSDFMDSSKRASFVSELGADFSLARTEAARRGKRVTVCVSSDGKTCQNSATDWATGWIIFSDITADGVLSAVDGDELLKRRTALSGNFSLIPAGFTRTGRIQFRPSGATDSEGALLLCKQGKSGTNGRQISIKLSGAVSRTSGVTCL